MGVNKILQLQYVILPTDSNCMIGLGMQNTEDEVSLPNGSEVRVLLLD